ncbi:MAG: hypothetical protein IKL81_02080, partial [Clostridia bacterium]|nr:hypothetical protein [Clostridia bacterium]
MKLNFKRLMAVLLSIMMIVGMMPMSVFAEDSDNVALESVESDNETTEEETEEVTTEEETEE